MTDSVEESDTSFKAPLSVSPAKKKGSIPDLNYEEPEWSGAPPLSKYELEVLKNGVIIESHALCGKNFFVLGRLPVVDIPQEHPSLSRHHAVIQFRPGAGFFLFDLDSAHGTFHNKKRILPRTYVPLRVGHSIKLGGSSRLLLLQGPEDDVEPETPMEVVKEHMAKKKAEEDAKNAQEEAKKSEEAERGISWGMVEDAVEEASEENAESNKPLQLDDPKKTLRHWFEREGYEMEYNIEEKGHANFICSMDIPTDTGEPLIAEGKGGSKREALMGCTFEACKMLDARGLLRASSASSKRKNLKKNWEDADYYDSDDDEFLDRTGSIQDKRKKRMKMANKCEEKVDNHESLKSKLSLLQSEKAKVISELSATKRSSAEEDLDDYMASLSGGPMDKHTIVKLKTKLNELKREESRLAKLIELTKPSNVSSISKETDKKVLPVGGGGVMIGKRFGGGIFGKTRIIPKKTSINEASSNVITSEETKSDLSSEKVTPKLVEKEDVSPPKEESENKKSLQNDSPHPKLLDKKEKESQDPDPKILDTKEKKFQDPDPKILDKKEKESSEPNPKLLDKEDPASSSDEVPPSNENRKKKKKPDSSKKNAPSICDEGKVEGSYSSSLSDPKYATWVPPTNQSGDGRTSLNDKFGY